MATACRPITATIIPADSLNIPTALEADIPMEALDTTTINGLVSLRVTQIMANMDTEVTIKFQRTFSTLMF